MDFKEMTKEQLHAHMKDFMERQEREAREWERQDNRRMRESLKRKLQKDKAELQLKKGSAD